MVSSVLIISKQLTLKEELLRVQVSQDKKYIYTGKRTLRVLQMDENNGNYLLLKAGSKVAPFLDIKLLRNGELLVYEENSSDLVKYSKRLREVSRNNGIKPINTQGVQMMSTRYTGDDLMYIWIPGDSSIGLVDPKSMVHDLVTNFYGSNKEKIIPFSVVADHKERKVLGLYIKRNSEVWFAFLRAGEGLIRKN